MGFLGDLFKGAAGAIPFAGPAIQGILGGISGSNQKSAEEDQRRLFNEWLQEQRGAGQDVISAAGGLSSLLGPQTSTGFSSGTGTSSTRGFNVTDPRFKGYEDTRGRLKGLVDARLAESSAVPQGEVSRRVASINKAFDPALSSAAGAVAASSPGGVGALGLADSARRTQIADLLGGLEGEARGRRTEDIGMGQQLGEMFRGSKSKFGETGTTTSNKQISQTGPVNASMLMSLRDLLAPGGPQASMNTGMSPWADAGGAAAGGLAALFADRDRKPGNPAGPMPTPYGYG